MRLCRGVALLLTGVSTALLGCAGSPASEDLPRWTARAVAALETRGDADSLWLAAMLSRWTPAGESTARERGRNGFTPGALALAEGAVAAAPRDPLVATIRMRICARVEGCDLPAAAQRVLELDPDNAAVLQYRLSSLGPDADAAAVDATLAGMAAASRYRIHWNAAITRGTAALVAVSSQFPQEPFPSRGAYANANVNGLAAGTLLPEFSRLAEACREAGERPARRTACLAIARQLQESDTLLAERVGFSIEEVLQPPGTPEHAAVLERRRVSDWRVARHGELMMPRWPGPWSARSREFEELQARLPREQDVMLAMLRAHGVPTEPPEGWTRDGS